jgi:tetratricopeptide (TPR) repeat protein
VAAKRSKERHWTRELPLGPPLVLRWGLFVLLGVVFVLKLVVLLQLKDHPLTSPDAGLDTSAYADLARRVAAGDLGLGPGLYYVSPLYIYVVAAVLAVFHSFTALRVVQIVLGTVSVGFIFPTTRAWFGERAAWIAAILAAFTGLFTFYEVLILQSAIDAFLTSAALYALTRGLTDLPPASAFRRKYLLLAGLIWGIQTLNRPNVLIAALGVALIVWLRLGRLAMEVKAPDVAEPFFRHATEMRPDLARARQQYGLNLLVAGRFDEALRELSEAVRLDPRDPDSLSHLAYAEAKLGRRAEARAHAEAALAIDPNDQLARELTAALR